MKVAIVGLGLIGGSLGMVLRKRKLAQTVTGFSRKPATLRMAKSRGAIDKGTANLAEAVRDADIVVLATPVSEIVPLALRCARFMKLGAVLTDVGSSKGEIVSALDRLLPKSVAFVGAHPVAGSEKRGIGAASPDIFDAASYCIIPPSARTSRRAVAAVSRLWSGVVPKIIRLPAKRHDELLAATSHLPHALAFALSASAPRRGLPSMPRSFLEMTRVAKSDPDLWAAILLSNRSAVAAAWREFDRSSAALRKAITRKDRKALTRLLAKAKARRDDCKEQ